MKERSFLYKMKIIGAILFFLGVLTPMVFPFYLVDKFREWNDRDPVSMAGLIALVSVLSTLAAVCGYFIFWGKI